MSALSAAQPQASRRQPEVEKERHTQSQSVTAPALAHITKHFQRNKTQDIHLTSDATCVPTIDWNWLLKLADFDAVTRFFTDWLVDVDALPRSENVVENPPLARL